MRDFERRRRSRRIQRARNEFDRIDRIDVDINRYINDRFDIDDDLMPDERLDDDGIHIKQFFIYLRSSFERDDGVFIGGARIVERGFVVMESAEKANDENVSYRNYLGITIEYF